MRNGFRPRRWQQECCREFEDVVLAQGEPLFVLEACPGAGKSAMAALMAHAVLRDDRFQEKYAVDHVIAVVPWASIQGVADSPDGPTGMCRAFAAVGLRVRDQILVAGRRARQPRPTAFDVSVVTYQGVINPEVLESIRLWRHDAGDWNYALVLDEVHHTRATGGAWGDAIATLRDQAALTVVMSGTYFRTDGHPIQFLRYESGQPVANYSYPYAQGLRDRCVRLVGFRHYDATFNVYDAEAEEEVRSGVRLSYVVNKDQLSAAQREVLSPSSPCVRQMIREAHADLQRTRQRFPDAGCLIVCKPGGSDDGEDRNVESVAAVVAELTGEQPVVMTHHDAEDVTARKLADFRDGSAPYLVAVNMVSEGCDIPRLRSVVFCRYTESEMLFRQIVGRALRLQPGDDDTAATVYVPAFPLMKRFAENIEGDCLQAIREMRDQVVVETHGSPPEPGPEPAPPAPRFLATNVASETAGGVIGGSEVGENYIRIAERLISAESSFLHSNKVQVGRAMQFFHAQTGIEAPSESDPPPVCEADRSAVLARIKRAIHRLANSHKYVHLGDKRYGAAWGEEFTAHYGVAYAAAKQQWSTVRLEEAAERLDRRAATEARRGT